MLKESNKFCNSFIKLIEKAHNDCVFLTVDDLLSILENIKELCHSKKYIESLIVCVELHLSKELPNTKMLTGRETEIIVLIGKGNSTAKIAETLNLSKFTVESHRKNIRKKFKHFPEFDLKVFASIYALQETLDE